jgi:hypothetical protein
MALCYPTAKVHVRERDKERVSSDG